MNSNTAMVHVVHGGAFFFNPWILVNDTSLVLLSIEVTWSWRIFKACKLFSWNHTFHKFVIWISSLRIKSSRPPDCIKCNQIRRRSLPRKSSIKRALALISVHSCLFSVCEQWKQCYDNFYRWQISLSKCKTNTGWCFLLWIYKMIAHIDKIYMWLIKICNPQFRQMKVK